MHFQNLVTFLAAKFPKPLAFFLGGFEVCCLKIGHLATVKSKADSPDARVD
jgi:hypothetical protein